MAGEWIASCLRDEADLLTGFPFKSEGYTDAIDGVRLLRGDNIVQAALRWDGVKRWPRDTAQEFSNYALAAGDVVLAMDRPWIEAGLKFAAISPADLPCLLVQRTARFRGGNKLDIGFLRYLIGSREFTQHVLAVQTGTTVPHISARQILDFEFLLPPLPEQKRIAHILGTLDDKIELNRRMNATLEGISRAIFKSWFVDFDPVRQKAAGKQPVGMDAQTAAMFPDSFEESEIGEVPKGWTVQPISELADIAGGSTPSTKEPQFWEGGVHHWATPKDLSDLTVPVLLDTERRLTVSGVAQITSGLLPVGTVLLSSRAPIGYLAVAEASVAINQGFIAMKPKDGVSNLFLLRWTAASHDEIVSRANGSTFLEISKSNFRPIPAVRPTQPVMDAFHDRAFPLFRRVIACERESRTLATLRDTLLPKLLSGEIRVPEAQEAVEEVLG